MPRTSLPCTARRKADQEAHRGLGLGGDTSAQQGGHGQSLGEPAAGRAGQ